MKGFHSDQAIEYVALGAYFRQSGIIETLLSAYTPEANGLAEKFNHKPLIKARAMFSESGLSPKFWEEAVVHAAYLNYVTPTGSKYGKAPFKLLIEGTPSWSKL